MNKELSDISGKLEIYRNNLLNLSLRNNQISYNPKSTRRNQIRIIDEIPEIICEKILNGKKMSLEFLPPLPKTPPDEDTPKFKNAYQNALNIYENYESNEIEENEKGEIDNYILDFIKDKKEAEENNLETEEHEKIDRTLKDSIRVKLGLGPLEDSFPTESQWAKKNNIIPNYDLPLTKDIDSEEKKYNDTRIQTLFFQEEGQIKFDKLIAQNNNLINERGVNALWIAIGFLEYKIAKQADQFKYAPILFQEINIEKKDPINKGGKPVYNITNGGEVSLNKTFEKFLKKEFDISLPNFSHDKYKNEENFQIDQYLNDFEDAVSTQDNWRVRRFMNIGLFSFYEAEMYNDLDPERWSESHKPKDSKILKELLSTSEKSSDIDEGEIEIGDIDNENVVPEMPSLVYDANYSQISTIIRALDGNNIAVKGPPGTGKSQTITNLILAALERGKRVLFVAQKKAALDVVYRQIEKKRSG